MRKGGLVDQREQYAPVVEEPKADEKPTLVLTIGSGTYPIFLQFSTKNSTSLEERIKQMIRDEVLSAPA